MNFYSLFKRSSTFLFWIVPMRPMTNIPPGSRARFSGGAVDDTSSTLDTRSTSPAEATTSHSQAKSFTCFIWFSFS